MILRCICTAVWTFAITVSAWAVAGPMPGVSVRASFVTVVSLGVISSVGAVLKEIAADRAGRASAGGRPSARFAAKALGR